MSGTIWIKRKTNKPVLDEFSERRRMINAIMKRKPTQHQRRHNQLIAVIVNGKKTK